MSVTIAIHNGDLQLKLNQMDSLRSDKIKKLIISEFNSLHGWLLPEYMVSSNKNKENVLLILNNLTIGVDTINNIKLLYVDKESMVLQLLCDDGNIHVRMSIYDKLVLIPLSLKIIYEQVMIAEKELINILSDLNSALPIKQTVLTGRLMRKKIISENMDVLQ